MKYCTEDCSHFFDTKEECLEYERNNNLTNIVETEYLASKINSQTALLNHLMAKYSTLTKEEFQVYTFDGKLVIKPQKKGYRSKYTMEQIRNIF